MHSNAGWENQWKKNSCKTWPLIQQVRDIQIANSLKNILGMSWLYMFVLLLLNFFHCSGLHFSFSSSFTNCCDLDGPFTWSSRAVPACKWFSCSVMKANRYFFLQCLSCLQHLSASHHRIIILVLVVVITILLLLLIVSSLLGKSSFFSWGLSVFSYSQFKVCLHVKGLKRKLNSNGFSFNTS